MKRFNITETGYKYDKIIFNTVLILICMFVFLVLYNNDFDLSYKPYINCFSEYCENPFYLDSKCHSEWCYKEFLIKGEYGHKPNTEPLKDTLLISVFGFIIAFGLNHFLHNKGKKIDVELRITDKKKVSLGKLIK